MPDEALILLVEDDTRLRERMARYLTNEKFRVIAVGDAEEAHDPAERADRRLEHVLVAQDQKFGLRPARPALDMLAPRAPDLEDAARTFDLAVLPLHGDLPVEEQDLAVRPATRRKIILATNVAETSLTVPGIRYVVDTGLARVKRYSYRNKVEQLRIENVSQAAARQRAPGWKADPAALERTLDTLYARSGLFTSILAADAGGLVIAGAPSARRRAVVGETPTPPVTDREYFTVPMSSGRVHVSGVFRGRRFGTDLLIAASAPVR